MMRIRLMLVAASLLMASPALAHVTSNYACTNCHGSGESGHQTVNTALVTSAATDPGVTAGLPKFKVFKGATAALSLTINNGSDQYGPVIGGWTSATTDTGVLNAANILTFTADSSWNPRTSGGFFATKGPSSFSSTTNVTYNMAVSASTPADYYLMTFKTTGVAADMWTQSQNFYLQVMEIPEPLAVGSLGLLPLLLRRRF